MAVGCNDVDAIRIQSGIDAAGDPIYDEGRLEGGVLTFGPFPITLALDCGLQTNTPTAGGNGIGDAICLSTCDTGVRFV